LEEILPDKKPTIEERINSRVRDKSNNEDAKSNKSNRSGYNARSKKNFVKLNQNQVKLANK
jgi:hypothetical protein